MSVLQLNKLAEINLLKVHFISELACLIASTLPPIMNATLGRMRETGM